MVKLVSERIKNIVGKGVAAMLSEGSFLRVVKTWDCMVSLNCSSVLQNILELSTLKAFLDDIFFMSHLKGIVLQRTADIVAA